MAVLETLSNILPVIASVSVFILICLDIYTRLRRRFSVRVNCWFCNAWLKVPYKVQNSWNCPLCEQYNGFTSDGDYNQAIPAQHDELMNKAIPLKTKINTMSENGLCNICNHNQRLKVHQLATFSPLDESKYDEEIDRYKEQLERSYRLCPQCEKVLKLTLQRQKSTILDQQLLKIKSNITKLKSEVTANVIECKKSLNFLIFLIAVYILIEILLKCNLLKKYHKTLPIILLKKSLGTTTVVVDVTTSYLQYFYGSFKDVALIDDIQKYLYNVFTLITENQFFKFYTMLKVNRVTFLSILGTVLQLVINGRIYNVKLSAWIASAFLPILINYGIVPSNFYPEVIQIFLACFLMVLHSSFDKKKIKIKKSPIKKQVFSKSPEKDVVDFKSLNNSPDTSLNTTRSISPLSTSTDIENFSFFKSAKDMYVFGQKATFENPFNFTKFSPEIRSPFNDSNFSNTSDETIRLNESFGGLNNSTGVERELQDEFKKLHLGSFSLGSNFSNKTSSVFRVTSAKRPKPVLTPPKLNVTQSSWVAGGYWKPPYDYNVYKTTSSLSRSSSQSSGSQSSGFGSQTSSQNLNSIDLYNSLPNSRNTSICGEYDRLSVFSETPYHFNKTRIYTNFPQDQSIYIGPRKSSPPDSWKTCDSNCSFRPSSRSSVTPFDITSNSIASENNLRNTNSKHKNGYSRGTLDNWHSFK